MAQMNTQQHKLQVESLNPKSIFQTVQSYTQNQMKNWKAYDGENLFCSEKPNSSKGSTTD